MIERVLIANRGEVALRVVRACRELGLDSVAAHSRVDSNLLHLRFADDSVCIGEHSYLDADAMIAAAVSRGCDAIHPGYGMLAENADFARRVRAAGLCFVGPSAEHIALMGDKVAARDSAIDHGLQTVPGSTDAIMAPEDASKVASHIGFPVLVKAAFGGGGRGMRIVDNQEALANAFMEAQEEARASFGRADVYIEKYLGSARHIEVQVIGDGNGRAIHLGTRECSIQRKYQKLIEEAPAPGLPAEELDDLATRCATATADMGYGSAGTFEFLYQDGSFFFIEMNTRLQVEHPVSEAVTDIDIVKLQLEVARDGVLPVVQQEVAIRGNAIECRVNAETFNPSSGSVMASPGLAYDYVPPGGPGVRVDSHLYNGYLIPHYYDSLIAKVICAGVSRREALARAERSLVEFEVRGIDTNVALLKQIVASDAFRRGEIDTHFLEKMS